MLEKGQLVEILLVEDDEIDQENIKRAFKKNNIINRLHVANDGVEALEMLQGTNGRQALDPIPQIMLLDINMPRMDGLSLLRKLRELPEFKTISTIVLTTSDAEKDIINAYDLNVAGYIIKPVRAESFIQTAAQLKLYWALQKFPGDRAIS